MSNEWFVISVLDSCISGYIKVRLTGLKSDFYDNLYSDRKQTFLIYDTGLLIYSELMTEFDLILSFRTQVNNYWYEIA